MSTPEDDDWTSGILITQPLARLKQKAHDLFDPIWRDDRSLTRSDAYVILSRALGVSEPQAHFRGMPRHRLAQAIAILPDLRQQARAWRATRKGGSG